MAGRTFVGGASLSLLCAGALALSSCAPAERRAATDPDASVSSTDPQPPARLPGTIGPGELFGQWRLTSLTGAPLSGSPPLHLLVGQARIEATSQCIPFAFAIRFAAPGRVAIRPEPWPDPVCERGRSPAEEIFRRIMAAARRVERRPGGRVAFVGAQGEALVERPPEPVTNPFGNSPGPEPWQMWGAWRLERLNGAPAVAPVELIFYHRLAEARSGCVSFLWRLGWASPGAFRLDRDATHATCERAPLPDEEALIRILDGAVRVDALGPLRRRLVGRAGSVTLVR